MRTEACGACILIHSDITITGMDILEEEAGLARV